MQLDCNLRDRQRRDSHTNNTKAVGLLLQLLLLLLLQLLLKQQEQQ